MSDTKNPTTVLKETPTVHSIEDLAKDYQAARRVFGYPEHHQGATDPYHWCEHVTLHLLMLGCRNGSAFEVRLFQEWAQEAAEVKAQRKRALRGGRPAARIPATRRKSQRSEGESEENPIKVEESDDQGPLTGNLTAAGL